VATAPFVGRKNIALILAATSIVLAVTGLGLLFGGRLASYVSTPEPTPADLPQTEEDVVVQTWWRRAVPAAHVTGCRDTGVSDYLTGGSIWVCKLWYVDPRAPAFVCVTLEEHVVRGRIRRDLENGINCA
jgi:hypothetical protein